MGKKGDTARDKNRRKYGEELSFMERSQKNDDYRNDACDESFVCRVCGKTNMPSGAGSEHRNHCSDCLSSAHLDTEPGDRSSYCRAVMDPIAVWVRKDGEWALIHRCRECGKLSSNRIAADDNPVLLMSIAVRPLAQPPFPMRMLNKYLNAGNDNAREGSDD